MNSKDIARLDARIDKLTDRIGSLIDRLDTHISNHHGRHSIMRQGGAFAALAALITFGWELFQKFALA